MTFWQSIILGAIQGVTEFLPVSSSGHLVLLQNYFGWPDGNLAFDTTLHFATLLAVIFYFRKELLKLDIKELKLITIATLPLVVVALLFRDFVESLFSSSILVSVLLIVTGLINFLADRKLEKSKSKKQFGQLNWKNGLTIGCFQAFALLPGISRSGSTILGSLQNDCSRRDAFRFSFLLAIPAIIGAVVFQWFSLLKQGMVEDLNLMFFASGAMVAFVVGVLSLKLFEYTMLKARLDIFSWYCIGLGLVGLGFLFF